MQYTLIAYDATDCGPDNVFPERLQSIYRVVDDYDVIHDNVRILANEPNVEEALLAALPAASASKVAALADVSAIPSWAHWTAAEANAWGTTNIGQPLAQARTDLGTLATLNLTTFKVVIGRLLDILDAMWILQKALGQMIIALRNNTWPHLQN